MSQDQAFAAEWLPVDVEDFNLTPIDGDFAFTGDVNLASDDQLLAGWNFADDSRALVNPIPAPGTLALLALGLFGIRAAQKKIVS